MHTCEYSVCICIVLAVCILCIATLYYECADLGFTLVRMPTSTRVWSMEKFMENLRTYRLVHVLASSNTTLVRARSTIQALVGILLMRMHKYAYCYVCRMCKVVPRVRL